MNKSDHHVMVLATTWDIHYYKLNTDGCWKKKQQIEDILEIRRTISLHGYRKKIKKAKTKP